MKKKRLWLKKHKWFLRTSNYGKPVGKWNDHPDWKPTNKCDEHGFYGIDEEANAFGLLPGLTLELCEWRGERAVVDGTQIKVSSYRVVATDTAIPDEAFEQCGYRVFREGRHVLKEGDRAIVFGGHVVQHGGKCYAYGGRVKWLGKGACFIMRALCSTPRRDRYRARGGGR